jgi:hypothetical protein
MGLLRAQRDVTGMIGSGSAFDTIEDRIDEIPDLSDGQRAALWLYAWSRQGGRWQRQTADRLLSWVATGD